MIHGWRIGVWGGVSMEVKRVLSFSNIVTLSIVLHVILLVYGTIQDLYFSVKYTDIDYEVFTDASRYVHDGESPYLRTTYRYTPLLAYLLVPNIYFPIFGKVLFSCCNIIVGILLQAIGYHPYGTIFWLLNPIVLNISTRGNMETILSVLLLFTLYGIRQSRRHYDILAGISYGLVVHLKIYPIIYSFSFFLWLYSKQKKRAILFTIVSASTFILLAMWMYSIYGYPFLHHTYTYHITRQDHRHNFSLYFYGLYLAGQGGWGKVLSLAAFLPQLLCILVFSVRYAEKDIARSLFLCTITFVCFNKVSTVQYFIWYITFIPLMLHRMPVFTISFISTLLLWFGSMLLWLGLGYLLEFQGWNVFLYLWMASILFFLSHILFLRQFTAMK